MNRERVIYVVLFPLAVVVLCGFSFYLGFSRGKQAAVRVETEGPGGAPSEPHEIVGELTFFKTLKGKEGGEAPPENLRKAEERAEIDAGGGTGSSLVQVSAFRDIGKAHEMVDELKNRGFRAFTKSSPGDSSGRWYRVYVGPFPSKEEASGVLKALTDIGFGGGFLTSSEPKGTSR